MAEAEKYNSIYTGQQIDNAVGAGLAVRGVNGLVKSDGNGNVAAAVPGVDYQPPMADAASGPIATFERITGGMPVNSLIAEINAVQSGSGTPSSSNIRPLVGFSSIDIPHAGRNSLVDNKIYPYINDVATDPAFGITINKNVDGSYQITGNKTNNGAAIILFNFAAPDAKTGPTQYDYKKWLQNGNYKAHIRAEGLPSGADVWLQVYSYNSLASSPTLTNIATAKVSTANTAAFTVSEANPFVMCRLYINAGTYSNLNVRLYPMIYRADDPNTEWEPPMPSTNVSLGRTVWGGYVDVITGELVVTHDQIASYNGETLPGKWKSDRNVYAAGTSPSTGAQVVYELAEPVTYQLSGVQIASLLGENNIWATSGNVYVEFGDDIKSYVDSVVLGAIGGSY